MPKLLLGFMSITRCLLYGTLWLSGNAEGLMDDDEFETECLALEAIFAESYYKEADRKVRISVEPTSADGEALTGSTPVFSSNPCFQTGRFHSR